MLLLFAAWALLSQSATASQNHWTQFRPLGVQDALFIAPENGFHRLFRVRNTSRHPPELIWERSYPSHGAAENAAWHLLRREKLPFEEGAPQEKSLESAPLPTQANFLWEAKEAWSWEWEERYARWIAENVDETFFEKHRIRTDCADVAVALRWIFSRIHGLPAAFHLMGAGQLFHHEVYNESWAPLTKHDDWTMDARFLASLEYVLRLTYTHSLFNDSYPIEIRRETFLPGVHHLSLHSRSGHTQFVARTDLSDESFEPITIIASTTPRSVRKLMRHDFADGRRPTPGQGGFLRVRWPVRSPEGTWVLTSEVSHPHYSAEQYAPDFSPDNQSFADSVIRRLNPNIDFGKRLKRLIEYLKTQFNERIQIVEEGFQTCQRETCEPGTPAFEAHSTPGRDQRLSETLDSIEKLIEQLPNRRELPGVWSEAQKQFLLQLDGFSFRLGQLAIAWREGWFGSDPRKSIADRWGVSPSVWPAHVLPRIKASLDERAKQVQEGLKNCAGEHPCEFLSESWSQNHSHQRDHTLRKSLALQGEFIAAGDEVFQQTLREKISTQTFSWGDQTLHYEQLLEHSLWLSAEPKDDEKTRWGGRKSLYRSHLFRADSDHTLSISEKGVAITSVNRPPPPPSNNPLDALMGWITPENAKEHLQLLRLSDNRPLLPPEGKHWLHYSPRADVALAYSNPTPTDHRVDVVNSDGQTLDSIAFQELEDVRFAWINSFTLIRARPQAASGQLWIFRTDGTTTRYDSVPLMTLVSDGQIAGWVVPTADQAGTLVLPQPDGLTTQTIRFPVEPGNALWYANKCASTLKTCIIFEIHLNPTNLSDTQGRTWLLELESGRWKPLSELRPFSEASTMPFPDGLHLLEFRMSHFRILEIVSFEQVRELSSISMIQSLLQQPNYLAAAGLDTTGQKLLLFQGQGDQWQQLQIELKGRTLHSLSPRHLALAEPDGSTFLYKTSPELLLVKTFPASTGPLSLSAPWATPSPLPLQATWWIHDPFSDSTVIQVYDEQHGFESPLFNAPLSGGSNSPNPATCLRGSLGPKVGNHVLWYEKGSEHLLMPAASARK